MEYNVTVERKAMSANGEIKSSSNTLLHKSSEKIVKNGQNQLSKNSVN